MDRLKKIAIQVTRKVQQLPGQEAKPHVLIVGGRSPVTPLHQSLNSLSVAAAPHHTNVQSEHF